MIRLSVFKSSGIAVVLVLSLLLLPLVASAASQNLTYDSFNNATNISFDGLNRILAKNFSSGQHNYSYDRDYEGTLANVTFPNGSVTYEYDDKLRVVKETRVVDGLRFEKQVVYDSADRAVRLVPITGEKLDYAYTGQGLLDGIKGFVNSTRHNALGNAVNRSYANSKVTNLTYNGETRRLARINTDSIQNLLYGYDKVGNIIMINDSANSRLLLMTYDNLDRLTNVSVNGARSFVYAYDALGNLLKIIRDGSTTLLLYGSKPVHAPYMTITGNSNLDVQSLKLLTSGNKSKVLEFYLANEINSTVAVGNWSAEFGDGNFTNSTLNISLNETEFMAVFVEHNYLEGGAYMVNVTSGSPGSPSDIQTTNVKFGISMLPISILSRSITNISYRFIINNNLADNITGVSWECNTGQNSDGTFTMNGLSNTTVTQTYNYSSAGIKMLNCSVSSDEGNDSKGAAFEVKGIEIEGYNRTTSDGNTAIVRFNITNHYFARTVNWKVTSDGQTFTGVTASIETGSSAIVEQEINYTTSGKKTIRVEASAGENLSGNLSETFSLKSLEIENYNNYNGTAGHRMLEFFVKNYWAANISSKWNITEPEIVSNNTNLSEGEALWVFAEANYTTQGAKNPAINAYNGSFASGLVEKFVVKFVEVVSLAVLSEGQASTISEAFLTNNEGNRNLSWSLNTGENTITAAAEINESEKVLLIIETNYTKSDVYNENLSINVSARIGNASVVVLT